MIHAPIWQCLDPLEKEKLLQVSSDGPNVNLFFLKVLTEKCKDEELSQLTGVGTCDFHTGHNAKSMEKKLQIRNSKNWCHLWAKYSMKDLEGMLITKLLPMLRRRITSCNFYSQVSRKWCGCEKSKGDMVKSYWSSILVATIT